MPERVLADRWIGLVLVRELFARRELATDRGRVLELVLPTGREPRFKEPAAEREVPLKRAELVREPAELELAGREAAARLLLRIWPPP